MTPLLLALALLGCRDRAVPVQDGQPANVVMGAELAYVSLAGDGVGVVDPGGATVATVAPPEGVDGVHALAMYNALLFGLDATPPGHLLVYDLEDPRAPALVGEPRAVPVGPFTGLAVHNGVVVVSGGDGPLSMTTYDGQGALGAELTQARYERSTPDVALHATGELGFVSTRFNMVNQGESYGLMSLRFHPPPAAPEVLDRLYLPGAGYTAGVASPADFPLASTVQAWHLYVAHGAGLAVVDVSDPADIQVRSVTVLPVFGVDVAVEGERAYVVGSRPMPMLVELDVRKPDLPQVLEAIPLPEDALATGVAVRKGRVMVAAGPAGVLVFEREPPAPEERVEHDDDPIGPYLLDLDPSLAGPPGTK
ncbi:MAG: hypothetical protein H6739_15940 [Alphaproteobacteria bacterium]|nr:hypothetical protein [Alphaproteobacteria bacterium]